MWLIDQLFVLILEFSVIAFVLLAAGVIALCRVKQPIERIRLIQLTLASVFLAALLGHSRWIPSTELAWLPVETAPRSAVVSAASFATTTSLGSSADTSMPDFQDANTDQSLAPPTEATLPPEAFQHPRPTTALLGLTAWQMVKSIVVIGFVAICGLQALYFLVGYFVTHRLLSSANPLELPNYQVIDDFQMELGGDRVRLAISEKISIPIASGILRPTIVVPKELVSGHADPVRVRYCLDHEWKHIERKDLVTWQLTSICQILLWAQPFYWKLRRELRLSQDQIADQFAAREDAQTAYATTLVEFSKARHSAMLGALTMAGSKSNLYRRVEMLLNSNFTVAGFSRKRLVMVFAGLMTAASFSMASLQLTRATDDTRPSRQSRDVESSAEMEPAEHVGWVIDAIDGASIANATVIVTRMRSDTWEEIDVTESKTDASGKFSFTIPVEQLRQRYLYIMFDLRHETYAPRHCGSYSYAMIRKNLALGAEPWFTKLKMVPGARIGGRLVDSDGQPVVGAALRVKSQADTPDRLTGQSYLDAMSDGEGRFEAIVTAEGDASVSVIPIDHCMKHVELGSQRGDLGDITVIEGISISGQVLDAVGEPLEGVWVNLTEKQTKNEASYEARRSSKTGPEGDFHTRPLKPGKYEVTVEAKATGALEKHKYANFHSEPPPAVFVTQTIEVTESDKPFVIQAVPHVYIKGQCYNPQGEFTTCHFPSVMGQFNKQFMWIHARKGQQVGEFEILVPHGLESARLTFSTNEHTGLMVQLPGKEPLPQRTFQYASIEDDILGIKVVRYVAPILQVKVVDESGEMAADARVSALYLDNQRDDQEMMMEQQVVRYFETQENGIHRSSSLVPNVEFEVFAQKKGFKSERKRMTMEEGANEFITLELKRSEEEEEKADDVTGFFQAK